MPEHTSTARCKSSVGGASFDSDQGGVFKVRPAGSPVELSNPLAAGRRAIHDHAQHLFVRALLHGGPLHDSWWTIPDDEEPPRLLVPQEGLGAELPVLLADHAVHAGGWRYELERTADGRAVYVWAQDERPAFEFIAVVQDGPAEGYRMDVLGLVEPWPYLRLAPRPGYTPGGHMEWIHIPWLDTPPWEGEVLYELTGTLIPPKGGIPEAFYRQIDNPPLVQLVREDQ